mmetsp:Transcript_6020/g.10765  ORF Transcript_6020/g.10765 Transcript_6020/m.10765 type:complete len:114 (+) Transcript_6020:112-453(+)
MSADLSGLAQLRNESIAASLATSKIAPATAMLNPGDSCFATAMLNAGAFSTPAWTSPVYTHELLASFLSYLVIPGPLALLQIRLLHNPDWARTQAALVWSPLLLYGTPINCRI